jgi:RNase P protein component
MFEPGYDIVIVARAKSKDAFFHELEADFLKLCKRLGICGNVNEKNSGRTC